MTFSSSARRNLVKRSTITIFAALGSILCLLFMTGVFKDARTLIRDEALNRLGQVASAHVDSASYSPDGGDPNGWTTDVLTYTTSTGDKATATTGHHGPAATEKNGSLHIAYNPQDTSYVRIIDNPQSWRISTLGDTIQLGVGIVVTAGIILLTCLLIIALLRSNKKSTAVHQKVHRQKAHI